mgnify:CR=1 FL=1
MNDLEELKKKPSIKKLIEKFGESPSQSQEKVNQMKKENYEGAKKALFQKYKTIRNQCPITHHYTLYYTLYFLFL